MVDDELWFMGKAWVISMGKVNLPHVGGVPPEKYIRSPDGELPALGNRLQEHRREIN
jgi:hypothetical protein